MTFWNKFENLNIAFNVPSFNSNYDSGYNLETKFYNLPYCDLSKPLVDFGNLNMVPFIQEYQPSVNFNLPCLFNSPPPPEINFNSFNNYPTIFDNQWQNIAFTPPNFNNTNLSSLSINTSNSSTKKYFTQNYALLSKNDAEEKACKDNNLEKLKGGTSWSISQNSFKNDIPYAAKGINKFLDDLTSELNINLTITSALGTKNSPHVKNGGHYDGKNPKLDFGGGLSPKDAEILQNRLKSTGYFSRVEVETHGETAHLDVKIKDSVLEKYT